MSDNKKILIIEDQKFISSIVALNLKKIGYDTFIAENGELGFNLAKREKPNLILLDIMMPVLNGFETLKLLKNNDETRKIPVIMLSALSQKSQIVEAINLGALDYITKPFNLDVAKQKINAVLKKINTAEQQERADTFPVFYKNYILIINCPDEFVSLEYIRKIFNSINMYKEEISEVIINASENKYIDEMNVLFFDKLFLKLSAKHIKSSIIVRSAEIESFFNSSQTTSEFKVFSDLSKALPSDINIEDIQITKKISAEDVKYPLPVNFKNGTPIIKFFIEPGAELITTLEECINQLINYHKKRIIIDFNNVNSVPARFAGTLLKYQTNLSINGTGKIAIVIRSQNLINQLRDGGFINKFEVYSDLDSALNNINL